MMTTDTMIPKALQHASNRNWRMAAVESMPSRLFAWIYRLPTHRDLRKVNGHWELKYNSEGHQAGKHEHWHLPRPVDALRISHIGEHPKLRVLKKYMEPLSTLVDTASLHDAVDVGAYIGEFARRIQGDVLALEADPRNAQYLRHNTDTNTTVVNCVAWYTDETLSFQLAADGSESALGTVDGSTSRHTTVQGQRIHTVCDEHDFEPDVVKIDAEGSEPEAVAGAVDLDCPIAVDVGPERAGQSTASAVQALLTSHKYRLHGPTDNNIIAATPD